MAAIFADYICKQFFSNKIVFKFDWNFTELCSQWHDQQCASIGSGNGLVHRRQVGIIWTNNDLVYQHIYASRGNKPSSEPVMS